MPRSHRIILAVSIAALLTGCASRPLALPADRPKDFALLLTVYPVADAEPPAPWLRPARYAVDPDGTLHAESGPGVAAPGFPPIARRLEPNEMDDVYTLAATADPFGETAEPVPGPSVYTPPADTRALLIETGVGGRYRAAAHPATTDGPLAPLVQELARLAWLDR